MACVSRFLFNFAREMKKWQTIGMRRQIAAWVLLWVFVPMMVLTSVHTHQSLPVDKDDCHECVNHVPHGGHLTASVLSIDNCLLCQFTTLPYLVATVLTTIVVCITVKKRRVEIFEKTVSHTEGTTLLRGPPAVFPFL